MPDQANAKQSPLHRLSSTLGRNMDGAVALFKEYNTTAWSEAFTTIGEAIARELKRPIGRNYRLVLEIGPRTEPSHAQTTVAGRLATAEVYPGYLHLMDNDTYVRKRGPASVGSRQIANVVFGKVSRKTVPALMGDLNSPEYLDGLEEFLSGREIKPRQKPKEIVDEALRAQIDDRLFGLGISPEHFREYLADMLKHGYSSDVELEAMLSPAFARDTRKWIAEEASSRSASPLLRQIAAKILTGRALTPDEYLYGLAYEAQYRPMDREAIARMLRENLQYLGNKGTGDVDLRVEAQAARYLKDAETPPFKISRKLGQTRIKRAEAHGIARTYPGMAELCEQHNRAALNRYFTRSEWLGVVESSKKYAEEMREKKKEGKRLDTDEQTVYDLVGTIERNQDVESAREAAIRLYSIPRAAAAFRTLKVVHARKALAEKSIAVKGGLIPLADMPKGSAEKLDMVCYTYILPAEGQAVSWNIRYFYNRTSGFPSITPVRNWVQKELPVVRQALEYGVVPKSLAPDKHGTDKLQMLYKIVEDFKPVDEETKRMIDELCGYAAKGGVFRNKFMEHHNRAECTEPFRPQALVGMKYINPNQLLVVKDEYKHVVEQKRESEKLRPSPPST